MDDAYVESLSKLAWRHLGSYILVCFLVNIGGARRLSAHQMLKLTVLTGYLLRLTYLALALSNWITCSNSIRIVFLYSCSLLGSLASVAKRVDGSSGIALGARWPCLVVLVLDQEDRIREESCLLQRVVKSLVICGQASS